MAGMNSPVSGLDDHSHKASVFCRGRDSAGVGFAHPSVSMPRNIIVEGITKGTGNHDAKVEQRPETGQVFHDSQGSRGFGVHTAMFQKHKGPEVFGGEMKGVQDLFRLFRLKQAEFELRMGVVIDRKVHPGVAPIADSVKDDDPFMPGPLVHTSLVSCEAQLVKRGYSVWLMA